VRIEQTVFVKRESQRKIVLGKDRHTIKAMLVHIAERPGPPVPVRQSARELGGPSGALP
jgi:hypothetical protein